MLRWNGKKLLCVGGGRDNCKLSHSDRMLFLLISYDHWWTYGTCSECHMILKLKNKTPKYEMEAVATVMRGCDQKGSRSAACCRDGDQLIAIVVFASMLLSFHSYKADRASDFIFDRIAVYFIAFSHSLEWDDGGYLMMMTTALPGWGFSRCHLWCSITTLQ